MNKIAQHALALCVPLASVAAAFPAPAFGEKLDDQLFTLVQIDEFEYRAQDGDDLVTWQGLGRIGTDNHKLALKTEGEYVLDADKAERAEIQLLYQRPVAKFFDAQIGVRHDFKPDPSRSYAVVGIFGLAPQWFEVDASLFASHKGDVSARFEAEYDLLLTQRLVLRPTAEINVAFSDDKAVGVGAGFSDIDLGLRLRYEIVREVAPYVGVNWERKLGKTADLARDQGEDDNVLSVVAGIRVFF